jgi:hypothetical protein
MFIVLFNIILTLVRIPTVLVMFWYVCVHLHMLCHTYYLGGVRAAYRELLAPPLIVLIVTDAVRC